MFKDNYITAAKCYNVVVYEKVINRQIKSFWDKDRYKHEDKFIERNHGKIVS